MSGRSPCWALAIACLSVPAAVAAQCVPPANSSDAKLLAFYEDPIVFATATAPQALALGRVSITGELTGIPSPGAAISHATYCFSGIQGWTRLSPVLPRPRVAVGLPFGFAVEGSYLPPITVANAQPNLGSLAVTYLHRLLGIVSVAGRFDGTIGTVKGPITCPRSLLQQTDPTGECFGTKPSDDTFYPRSIGTDGTIVVQPLGGRVTVYGGAGYTWMSPHFETGFTNADGVMNNTDIQISLRRASVFGGVNVGIFSRLDAGAQVYSAPADLTTWRLTARYRL